MATVSSVISSVKSWVSSNLSKYLPLGGGKMTGIITYVHTGLSIGTNPSATQYKAIHWSDNTGDTGNNHRLATVEYSCSNTGTAGLVIGPYQYIENRGNYNGSLLQLSVQSNGTKSIAWDGKPVVCVTRWTSGTSWYRVYSDGFIEQGGNFAGDGANVTAVTLHKPFSNTNYLVLTTPEYTTTSTSNLAVSKNTSYPKTTTGFYIYNSTTSTFGHYWYASGY